MNATIINFAIDVNFDNCPSREAPVSTADLLLHPHRLRIAQALLGKAGLTTADLRTALPEIPPATLYRHINALLAGGLLEVVEERPTRGAVERTYALVTSRTVVSGEEAAAMTAEEHRRAFLTVVAGLLADFDRYLDREDFDLERDLVGYRQVALHLSDEEMLEVLGELNAVIGPRMANEPGPGRVRRLFTTVLMPADD
jgi:DNA-binding transcriptional ArsR family regulator